MNRTVTTLPPSREHEASTRRVMALLAAGVPLSLLCDLADPAGPDSHAIFVDEPSPAATEAGFASHPPLPVTQFGL